MADKAFKVEVRRGGTPPTPYRWEIYRGGTVPVLRSLHRYTSEQAAREAGMQAMARLISSSCARKS
jgi:hypothetical protein